MALALDLRRWLRRAPLGVGWAGWPLRPPASLGSVIYSADATLPDHVVVYDNLTLVGGTLSTLAGGAVIVVRGDLTIFASGTISADGKGGEPLHTYVATAPAREWWENPFPAQPSAGYMGVLARAAIERGFGKRGAGGLGGLNRAARTGPSSPSSAQRKYLAFPGCGTAGGGVGIGGGLLFVFVGGQVTGGGRLTANALPASHPTRGAGGGGLVMVMHSGQTTPTMEANGGAASGAFAQGRAGTAVSVAPQGLEVI